MDRKRTKQQSMNHTSNQIPSPFTNQPSPWSTCLCHSSTVNSTCYVRTTISNVRGENPQICKQQYTCRPKINFLCSSIFFVGEPTFFFTTSLLLIINYWIDDVSAIKWRKKRIRECTGRTTSHQEGTNTLPIMKFKETEE